jgi:hypothetical protein
MFAAIDTRVDRDGTEQSYGKDVSPTAIGQLLDSFTPGEGQNYFVAAEYGST